jgi:hypothetical protein
MANLWSNTIAQDYVLTLKNSTKTSAVMVGIQSATQEDLIVYDTEYYRDELDAAFLGTARSLIVHETGGVSPVDVVISNGSTTNVVGSSNTTLSYAAVNDPQVEQSDSFTHTPPHPLAKTRSIIHFWSGATGTGNIVASCWFDQFIAITPVQVQRF